MICRKNAREARTLRPAGIAERTAKIVKMLYKFYKCTVLYLNKLFKNIISLIFSKPTLYE